MSEHQAQYVAERPSQTSALPVVLGLIGLLVSILGPVIVFTSSRSSGWWSLPYILILLSCGAVALTTGIMAIRKSRAVPGGAPAGTVLGIMATVVGSLIFALMGVILAFLLLLSASMQSYH